MVESCGVRWLLVLVALVAGSSFASDPESKPLVGPWLVELAVAPVSAQVNGLFVEHLGTAGQVAVVVAPYFRVFVSGTWNWQAGESRLARELFRTGRVSPNRIDQNDSSGLFISMGLVGGTEFVLNSRRIQPFHFPHRFELSMVGFAGALSTKAQLKPETARADGSLSPATFGDTGWRPTIGAGVGVRFEFFERFSIRVDLRESFFSSRVQTVNGCNVGDMRAIDNELRRGRPVTEAQLTPVCRVNAFDGTDPDTGLKRSNDVPLSLGLLRNPSVEWASLQALQVSFGVVF